MSASDSRQRPAERVVVERPAPAEPRWPRPAGRQPWVLVVGLVMAAVLVAAVLLPITGSRDAVATATLEPLGQAPEARAQLIVEDDQTLLEVTAPDLPPTDGYYEVWLMTREADALISLGPISTQTRATVPATVDTARYSVIDVSQEPLDGNPAHSTDSVLRGELRPID